MKNYFIKGESFKCKFNSMKGVNLTILLICVVLIITVVTRSLNAESVNIEEQLLPGQESVFFIEENEEGYEFIVPSFDEGENILFIAKDDYLLKGMDLSSLKEGEQLIAEFDPEYSWELQAIKFIK